MIRLKRSELISKIENDNYKFAWINTFSDLKLIELSKDEIQNVWLEDLNNLIEAKFFNKDREISIMPCDDEKNFSIVEFDGKNKEYVEEKQVLNRNKSPFKNDNDKLVIRNYLDYDDEGQAYICYSKLHNVEGGDSNDKQK